VLYVRRFVKEPEVWVANRDKQREQNKQFHAPLLDIFRRGVAGNTITACLWMASSFVVYYSVYGLFATHMQKDLNFGPALVALPIALANLTGFVASGFWGWVADRYGRRWAMIIPAIIGVFVTPFYLFTANYTVIAVAFIVQGVFLGAIYGQNPSYLAERFPTEVRATASGFCYHQGAVWGGLVGPVLAAFAVAQPSGFAIPMLVGTVSGALVFVVALLLGPETKGKVLQADITLAAKA
jgi:SHS family lactate transporter-like MFS transporter